MPRALGTCLLHGTGGPVDFKVKLGFVPSIRSRAGIPDWCRELRTRCIDALESMEGFEVVYPQAAPDGTTLDAAKGHTTTGAIANLDEGEVVAEYFRRQGVDGLVVISLNFGDERSCSKIAEELGVPVLVIATKEPPALENASLARQSDSYCGNLSICSGLFRRKIPFYYAGLYFPEDEEFFEEVDIFSRAVSAVKALKGARIGQVGVRPNTFETVAYDEVAMIDKFGQNVYPINPSDLKVRFDALKGDDPIVRSKMDAIRGSVSAVTVGEDYLVNAAKFELALTEFFVENKLSAMAVECWGAARSLFHISTCSSFGRMTEQGMLTACEVDVMGSLAMLTQFAAARGEVIPHFIDWTIQHRDNPNWLLAWHCGNAPASLAADPTRSALRSRRNMAGTDEVTEGDLSAGLYQFQIKPGIVTFCRLQEYEGDWKMLIATGEIVPSDDELAGTWSWVEVADHEELYRTLVEEGFVHHANIMHGDQADVLLEVCLFLDIEPVVVE
jgi:L-fucose isomerase-like protein